MLQWPAKQSSSQTLDWHRDIAFVGLWGEVQGEGNLGCQVLGSSEASGFSLQKVATWLDRLERWGWSGRRDDMRLKDLHMGWKIPHGYMQGNVCFSWLKDMVWFPFYEMILFCLWIKTLTKGQPSGISRRKKMAMAVVRMRIDAVKCFLKHLFNHSLAGDWICSSKEHHAYWGIKLEQLGWKPDGCWWGRDNVECEVTNQNALVWLENLWGSSGVCNFLSLLKLPKGFLPIDSDSDSFRL